MKNKILLVWLILLCIGLSTRSTFGLDKLRVGLSSISAVHGAIWVAAEKGLFKKYGIDAEVIAIGAGTQGIGALMAGDIPIVSAGGDAAINAIGLGAKARAPNAGKLFIDFILSKKGQEMIREMRRIPSRSDVKPLAAKMDQSKLRLKLVPGEVSANSDKYVEEFRKIFGL
jgi:hypothetical protein